VVLVDTSVWVEAFRKPSRIRLSDVVEFDEIVTCPPVVEEILRGFRDERAFQTARAAMLAFPVVESPLRMEVVLTAVDLFRRARRAGLTVRSGADCLIAACALRNGLSVLHHNRDFDALSEVSDLKAHAVET
jgi:predicted nucleic acid-binding protein